MCPINKLTMPLPKLPLFQLDLETTAIFGTVGFAASELHIPQERGTATADPSSSFDALTVLPAIRAASWSTFFRLERIRRAGHLEVSGRASPSGRGTDPPDMIASGRPGTAVLIAGRGQPALPCPSGSVISVGAAAGNG